MFQSLRSKLATIPAIFAVILMSPSAAAATDSFTVYVGYADTLRPSGFFPSIWIGGTVNGLRVISQTNPAGMEFDSGAVRIDNTGTTSIAISDFTVSDNNGTVVFNIWGSGTDLVLAPRQVGIFTQTNMFNFDSSDQGLFGADPPANLEPNNADHNGNTNLIGGCSSNSSFFASSQASGPCNPINAPIISFKENGHSVSFTDTGFILNTGEYDFVDNSAFGEDGNESINWNTIGGRSRGGDTTPEPGDLFTIAVSLSGFALLVRRRSV